MWMIDMGFRMFVRIDLVPKYSLELAHEGSGHAWWIAIHEGMAPRVPGPGPRCRHVVSSRHTRWGHPPDPSPRNLFQTSPHSPWVGPLGRMIPVKWCTKCPSLSLWRLLFVYTSYELRSWLLRRFLQLARHFDQYQSPRSYSHSCSPASETGDHCELMNGKSMWQLPSGCPIKTHHYHRFSLTCWWLLTSWANHPLDFLLQGSFRSRSSRSHPKVGFRWLLRVAYFHRQEISRDKLLNEPLLASTWWWDGWVWMRHVGWKMCKFDRDEPIYRTAASALNKPHPSQAFETASPQSQTPLKNVSQARRTTFWIEMENW